MVGTLLFFNKLTADKARLTYTRVYVEIGVDYKLPYLDEFVREDDK